MRGATVLKRWDSHELVMLTFLIGECAGHWPLNALGTLGRDSTATNRASVAISACLDR